MEFIFFSETKLNCKEMSRPIKWLNFSNCVQRVELMSCFASVVAAFWSSMSTMWRYWREGRKAAEVHLHNWNHYYFHLCVSGLFFSFFLHSFGPHTILHFVTLQSSTQMEERQVGKCKALVPMRHTWSLQGHNSTVSARCGVKQESAGLMQFALFFCCNIWKRSDTGTIQLQREWTSYTITVQQK